MKEKLFIYNYVDGVNDTPFHDSENPIELIDYKVDINLMGTFSINATLKYKDCLDNEFNGTQYVTFKGERYFIQNTPSSSIKNTNAEYYEHHLDFISEKDIVLGHTLFMDIVTDDSTIDRYQSNSSDVVFFGKLTDFVNRLNAISTRYSLGYDFTIDDLPDTTEEKMVAFKDKYILDAMREAYDLFKVPYFFEGKICHFGKNNGEISTPFEYGKENALLTIKKSTANKNIVRRITGVGSNENIPYYYPNNSPKGNISVGVPATNVTLTASDVQVTDYEKLGSRLGDNKNVTYKSGAFKSDFKTMYNGLEYTNDTPIDVELTSYSQKKDYRFYFLFEVTTQGKFKIPITMKVKGTQVDDPFWLPYITSKVLYEDVASAQQTIYPTKVVDGVIETNILSAGKYKLVLDFSMGAQGTLKYQFSTNMSIISVASWSKTVAGVPYEVNLKDLGVTITRTPTNGDAFYHTAAVKIPTSPYLMPSIYRANNGTERFYNAVNNTYRKEDGTYYHFNENNLYIPNGIVRDEGIENNEEIKPTIKGITNGHGQLIGQIADIAFDAEDSDETEEGTNNYLHQYFYVKLHRFDGTYGFNLFDSAIENGAMTFSMTSGKCGGCQFQVGVDTETSKNIVQVDENGNLKRDDKGNVLWYHQTAQDKQNNTIDNEVWIALKKEESTFGVVMPNATNNYKPSVGDTFVILNIKLPQAYITSAEKRLEYFLLDKLEELNTNKYDFSIDFSRIYFEENPTVVDQLKENTKVSVKYDNTDYDFNVLSYTYNAIAKEPLPQISVNLTKEVKSRVSYGEKHPDNRQVNVIVQKTLDAQPRPKMATASMSGASVQAEEADKVANPLKILMGETKQEYDGSESVTIDLNAFAGGGGSNVKWETKHGEQEAHANHSWLSIEGDAKEVTLYGHTHEGQLIRPQVMVVPSSNTIPETTPLQDNDMILFKGNIGFDVQGGSSGSGTSVEWRTSPFASEGYAKLAVIGDTEDARDVALHGHTHSQYATTEQLATKVDKENGKSLIADTEITRLASVDNYDDSSVVKTIKFEGDTTSYNPASNIVTLPAYPDVTDALRNYLPLNGSKEMSGALKIYPLNESGVQDGIILHDYGTGSSEGLKIKWTTKDFTEGTTLYPVISIENGIVTSYYLSIDGNKIWHAGNANNLNTPWSASKLKMTTLVLPTDTNLLLDDGEMGLYYGNTGFDVQGGGGSGSTNVSWDGEPVNHYNILKVDGYTDRDVALNGHKHNEYATSIKLGDTSYPSVDNIVSLPAYPDVSGFVTSDALNNYLPLNGSKSMTGNLTIDKGENGNITIKGDEIDSNRILYLQFTGSEGVNLCYNNAALTYGKSRYTIYHEGNANNLNTPWNASRLKMATLLIPNSINLDLGNGEIGLYYGDTGFDVQGGGSGGTNVRWDNGASLGYQRLYVENEYRDLALDTHIHNQYATTIKFTGDINEYIVSNNVITLPAYPNINNLMPKIGGNFTGEISVNTNQVWHAGNSNKDDVTWTAEFLKFGQEGKTFNINIKTSFRSSIFGDIPTRSSNFVVTRSSITIDNFSTEYGTGLAWTASDTQGFLNVGYNDGHAYIGGGSGENIIWNEELWHSGNSNKLTIPWNASKLKMTALVLPNDTYLSLLDNNEIGLYYGNTGFDVQGGGSGGTNVRWDNGASLGYQRLYVENEYRDLALDTHTHIQYATKIKFEGSTTSHDSNSGIITLPAYPTKLPTNYPLKVYVDREGVNNEWMINSYDGSESGMGKNEFTWKFPVATETYLGGIKVSGWRNYNGNNKDYFVQIDQLSKKAFVHVDWSDTVYTLPHATTNALGGIKVGGIDNSAILDDAHQNYKVYLNSNDVAYIHSPVGLKTEQGGEIFNDYINNSATGESSHAEGYGCSSTSLGSHAEGNTCTATDWGAHAEGHWTIASGHGSHAEGGFFTNYPDKRCTASNDGSHAEGLGCLSSGMGSHAEGAITIASGDGSHAEGRYYQIPRTNNIIIGESSGNGSHIEGQGTIASGDSSHAEGALSKVTGVQGHAEGFNTEASGKQSHTEGWITITKNRGEHAQGLVNISHTGTETKFQTLHSIGIGTHKIGTEGYPVANVRENALEVMSNGDFYIKGIGGYTGLENDSSFQSGVNGGTIRSLQQSLKVFDCETLLIPTSANNVPSGRTALYVGKTGFSEGVSKNYYTMSEVRNHWSTLKLNVENIGFVRGTTDAKVNTILTFLNNLTSKITLTKPF